ncbi:MAG TPA: FAD-dependent oxidoreductase [Verrucomicrobiae bacterium]|nr:FAD-dependent oxidoreductase [Verrucomicrobiae bacterium]
MPPERLLVIGAVAAGMSAATRARRLRSDLDITVLEKGSDVSYGACGLPFLLSGEVSAAQDLVVYDPAYFREKRGINVLLRHEAAEIEPGRKLVHALREGSHPVAIPYDKLILATGAAPSITFPGADLPGVFAFSTLSDASRLHSFLESSRPSSAIVVGSGYIGLEAADALASRGLGVTLLGRSETLLEGFAPEISARAEESLSARSIRIRKGAAVQSISASPQSGALHIHHSGGSESASLVILATGLKPQVSLAESAGVQLGPTGAIAVDNRLQTSAASIFAAGDCVETIHLVSGRPVYFPLGTTANKQGRAAGENAAGGRATFDGIVGTLATKIHGLELARTGLSLEEARAAGFHPDSVHIETFTHAKYLGGLPLTADLVWDRSSGRFLGFQAAAPEGAAKRVDAAAVALHARMLVSDLPNLDLSYAPPFAGVWEALLIAAKEALTKSRR